MQAKTAGQADYVSESVLPAAIMRRFDLDLVPDPPAGPKFRCFAARWQRSLIASIAVSRFSIPTSGAAVTTRRVPDAPARIGEPGTHLVPGVNRLAQAMRPGSRRAPPARTRQLTRWGGL